jgi:cell division septum initiation protein DivIVA
MKHINNFELFLEDINPNTPQGYLNSVSKKPIVNTTQQNKKPQTPTEEVDGILQNTEEQKQKILLRKDAIEKGLLNNIREMEPQNQKDVKTQVDDYKKQVTEFDKTVQQIGKLNQTLKKSNVPNNQKPIIQNARQKNF